MGLYTEAQQQEFIVSMRQTAQGTLRQLMQIFNLSGFGDNEESLRTLDLFADGYRVGSS